MSFSFVDSDGVTSGASSVAFIETPGMSVNYGDLVVAIVKWEGGAGSMTVDDRASHNLTQWSLGIQSGGSGFVAMYYTLSAQTSGTNSVIFRATPDVNRTFFDMAVMVYSPLGGTASTDGTPSFGTGNSNSLSSGNMTTTATDGIAFGGYGDLGPTTNTTEQINGVNRDAEQAASTAKTEIWSKTYSAGFTGAATVGFSGSGFWLGTIIAFSFASVANITPIRQVRRQRRPMRSARRIS